MKLSIQKLAKLETLFNAETLTLREADPNIIRDYLICIKDEVILNQWLTDIEEEPDAYPYEAIDVRAFLHSL